MHVPVEPFAAVALDEISSIYRGIWQDVRRAVSPHARIERIYARRRRMLNAPSGVEPELASVVSVSFFVEGVRYRFDYQVVGTEIDSAVFEDIKKIKKTLSLPWAFYADDVLETCTRLWYLPRAPRAMLD